MRFTCEKKYLGFRHLCGEPYSSAKKHTSGH